MKFLFHDSFVEIRRSQKLLIKLYQATLKRDIGTTMDLLNSFAPSILVLAENRKSRHYLKLGYRDAVQGKNDMKAADNFSEQLYSLRLYKYARAIIKAKHGKRYAFLSKLEQDRPVEGKVEDTKEWSSFRYEQLKDEIAKISEEKKDYYLTIHQDNFYKFKDKSFFDKIWENPSLNEIPEYQKYLEKN